MRLAELVARALARHRSRLRPADGARAAPVPDRPAARRAGRARRGRRAAVVYYTALLVNVGCHTDAHEQAKWFGDDIALKSTKYDHELRSLRGAAAAHAADRRGQPAAAPLPGRARVRALRAPRGRRHDRPARARSRASLAEQLGLPDGGARRARRGRTSSGTARAGRASCRATRSRSRRGSRSSPSSSRSRTASAASRRRPTLARKRSGQAVRPGAGRAALRADADEIFDGLDDVGDLGRGDRRPSRRSPSCCRGERFDAALRRDRELRRPQVAVHARALARGRRPRGDGRRAARARRRTRCARCAAPGLVHGFGRLGVSNAIWDKRGPLGAGEWERVRMHPYLTERMLQQSRRAGAARRDRRAAPRAPRRLGLPARPAGAARSRRPARILGAADAYQAMREPRPHRAARAPADAAARAARRGRARAGSTATPSRRCSAPPATGCAGAARARPGLTAREVEVLRLARAGAVEQGDRRSGS